jgi:hypothetical protein
MKFDIEMSQLLFVVVWCFRFLVDPFQANRKKEKGRSQNLSQKRPLKKERIPLRMGGFGFCRHAGFSHVERKTLARGELGHAWQWRPLTGPERLCSFVEDGQLTLFRNLTAHYSH